MEDSGEVKGLVEIPLRCPAVAGRGEHDGVLFLEGLGHRQASGVRQLSRDRDRNREHVDFLRPSHPALIPAPVLEELQQRVAPGEHRGAVPVHGDEPVVLLEGRDESDLGTLLPPARSVGAELPQGGEVARLLVEVPAEDHPLVHPAEGVGVDARLVTVQRSVGRDPSVYGVVGFSEPKISFAEDFQL